MSERDTPPTGGALRAARMYYEHQEFTPPGSDVDLAGIIDAAAERLRLPGSEGCRHVRAHNCKCDVTYLSNSKLGVFILDVRVICRDCGMPFRFIGLPAGVDLNGGATVSPNAEEARLVIAPKGEVIASIDGGCASGLTERKTK